ncbi:metallophosphoesterase family protein [Leptospira vanthielii]|uniref:Calcineurin-like phosphoesterase family protein n=1 Tax=Leptospira vanthielii serovar Holland str. Waz Holland = ATCC 700522 TaxID=1218591 RepID=N1VYE1_9LEPT|nr:metallophosphoesterase [Leptospira vanthielii]EMY68989.1 calcineurin-like phosphoesterase family protein [Leptospira vanthielii serovar Holland str. Waz Holland = ATCC 700522]
MKLLQVSDLHLSQSSQDEKNYSLAVLGEIFDTAEQTKCDRILFCGDLFNTFPDLEGLRSEFLKVVSSYSGLVYFLPGNHEILEKKGNNNRYADYDWSTKVKVLDETPYFLFEDSGIEFVSIPHQENYSGVLLSPPPPKKTKLRIGLAHGTVPGMSFTGLSEEEEEGGSYLDPHLIQNLGLDYLAIGHLHRARMGTVGNCSVGYAGSSRVWRKGESGPRGGIFIHIDGSKLHTEPVYWKEAGEYREILVSLDTEGKPEESIETYLEGTSPKDWIVFRFVGYVDSMTEKQKFQESVLREWKSKYRILEFDPDESQITVIQHLSENEFVKQFLDKMNERKDQMDPSLWKHTRVTGIRLILEGKKNR